MRMNTRISKCPSLPVPAYHIHARAERERARVNERGAIEGARESINKRELIPSLCGNRYCVGSTMHLCPPQSVYIPQDSKAIFVCTFYSYFKVFLLAITYISRVLSIIINSTKARVIFSPDLWRLIFFVLFSKVKNRHFTIFTFIFLFYLIV